MRVEWHPTERVSHPTVLVLPVGCFGVQQDRIRSICVLL
jgi:hypothetical protein